MAPAFQMWGFEYMNLISLVFVSRALGSENTLWAQSVFFDIVYIKQSEQSNQ